MAKYASFGKRENEKKKQARRVEKQNRKEERKSSGKATSFEDMIAYVDENGMITSVPPELRQKEEVKWSDYAGLRFSLHHGRLEQLSRVRRITPLPTTCCHKLPPYCKSIVPCEQRIYFAGKTDYSH